MGYYNKTQGHWKEGTHPSLRRNKGVSHIPQQNTDACCSGGRAGGGGFYVRDENFIIHGRLLTGQFKHRTFSIKSECLLQDISIGIQKTPCERMVQKLVAVGQAKTAVERSASRNHIRAKSSPSPEQHVNNTGGHLLPQVKCLPDSRDIIQASDCARDTPTADNDQALPLNKFDIKDVECVPETFSRVTVRGSLQFNIPGENTTEKIDDNTNHNPQNINITFTKPKRLFSMKSVERKLLEQKSRARYFASGEKRKISKSGLGGVIQCDNNKCNNQDKHRAMLEEGPPDEKVESVFGVQRDFHRTGCIYKSQKRRRVMLAKTPPIEGEVSKNENRTAHQVCMKMQGAPSTINAVPLNPFDLDQVIQQSNIWRINMVDTCSRI